MDLPEINKASADWATTRREAEEHFRLFLRRDIPELDRDTSIYFRVPFRMAAFHWQCEPAPPRLGGVHALFLLGLVFGLSFVASFLICEFGGFGNLVFYTSPLLPTTAVLLGYWHLATRASLDLVTGRFKTVYGEHGLAMLLETNPRLTYGHILNRILRKCRAKAKKQLRCTKALRDDLDRIKVVEEVTHVGQKL